MAEQRTDLFKNLSRDYVLSGTNRLPLLSHLNNHNLLNYVNQLIKKTSTNEYKSERIMCEIVLKLKSLLFLTNTLLN